jgi:hypothetical protein
MEALGADVLRQQARAAALRGAVEDRSALSERAAVTIDASARKPSSGT